VDDPVDRLRAAYDAVPYESHAFPQSAPGRLAAIAYLFGLDAADVSTARVLEIGCAAGGNLIPFAMWHPHARVVGIDLSAVQIEQGRRRVQALGLANLELLHGDLAAMELTALGQFDFIICHGVYSWVPSNVQDAILAAFNALLSPEGVAYISYNVYPGWKAKEILRDAMLLRGGERATPEEKLVYARGMIDFLEKVAPADSVVGKALTDFRADNTNTREYYVLHEYLEPFNTPCYFLDFGRRAEPYRLTYLADANVDTMFASNFGEQISEPLLNECGHSQVLVEQYLDFFTNRAFRQSLLVRGERAPQISFQPDRRRFGRLHFAAWLPPVGGEVRLDHSKQEFGEPEPKVFAADPGVKAALNALNSRWPWTISRLELLDDMRAQLRSAHVEASVDLETNVDALLEYLIVRGLARFRLDPLIPVPPSTPLRLDQPTRRMAEVALAESDPQIFNLWHEMESLSAADRNLLPLLDGTRDRTALVEELVSLARADVITFELNGEQLSGELQLHAAVVDYVDMMLVRLTKLRLMREDNEQRHEPPSTARHRRADNGSSE
jgi:methyltransferase-like protein